MQYYHFNLRYHTGMCGVKLLTYPNGRIAIVLIDDAGPVAKATYNVPGLPVEPCHTLIRNSHEVEGVLPELIRLGLIDQPMDEFQCADFTLYHCKVNLQN